VSFFGNRGKGQEGLADSDPMENFDDIVCLEAGDLQRGEPRVCEAGLKNKQMVFVWSFGEQVLEGQENGRIIRPCVAHLFLEELLLAHLEQTHQIYVEDIVFSEKLFAKGLVPSTLRVQ